MKENDRNNPETYSAVNDDESKLPILFSIEPVVSRCSRVSFNPERLGPAAEQWGHVLEEQSNWHHPALFFDGTERTVRWIFVSDVLNHCFWPNKGEPAWAVDYRGERFSGYWGLAAGLKRAVERGIPITEARFLSSISAEDLRRVLGGAGEIPLLGERLFNLREAGRVLESEWEGDIVHLIAAARGSAVRAVRLVTSSFPSFRDQAEYRGQTVYFWKRAQIFISDLNMAFAGTGWGNFEDIGNLTAFADYKLPQVLRELGVISYDRDLSERVDRMEELEPQTEEEVEIRAMTVHAVEAFRKAFAKSGRQVTAVQVDNWLWQLGQLEPFRQRPYHRCRTIFY